MRRSKNFGIALIGLLAISAISLAVASGRKSTAENSAANIRMLSDAEAAQLGNRFPGLRVRPGGISQLRDDLLARLFPNTSFYKTLNRGGRPPFPYLIAISGDKVLSQPSGFNWLLAEHNMEVTDKNIIELAKAFVVLAIGNEPITNPETGDPGGLDSFPQITFLQGKRIEEHDRPSATAIDVEINCRIGDGGVQTWKFTQSRRTPRRGEWVKVGQFARALLFIDGKPVREYRPEKAVQETRRGELDTDPRVEIDVTVGNATVEQESNYCHYYLETYLDGAPTNYWVRFKLYAFESHEPYVYVRVEPKWPYIYGPSDTLGPIDIDESGEGCYDWTPSPGIQTGIAEVCAGNMPPGDTFCQRTPLPDNKELTLEKVIKDTFPGAGDDTLEVYFCHQFFVNHPEGQGYAPTFANLVKDAAIESWQKQVNDWGLDTPPDPDLEHQVFINDSVNWYHSFPFTWAEWGPNRKIAIQSRLWYRNNTDKAYSSESIRVKAAVAHEFYHGIQWGLDSAKVVNDDWNWFTEAQARFIQSAQYPDEEFSKTGGQIAGLRQYARDANKYLIGYLNTSLRTLSSNDSILGYPYCLYWRFMYEKFLKNSISIVRDCYAESVGTGSSISEGKKAIDRAIAKYWGPGQPSKPLFSDFLHSIDSFAVACYLNDTSFGLWHDPNHVYKPCSLTVDDSFRLGPAETDSILVVDSVPNSYGFDLMQLRLNGDVDTLLVKLSSVDSAVALQARAVRVFSATPRDTIRVDSLLMSSVHSAGWRLPTQDAGRVCLVITRQDTLDDLANGADSVWFKVKRAVAVSDSPPISDTVIAGSEFTPRAVVANRGWMKEVFDATFDIEGAAYSSTVACTLAAGASKVVEFAQWTTTAGTFATCCNVYIASDTTRMDDTLDCPQ